MKDPTCLRTEYFVPSFAVDGANGSRWMSAAEDSINPWIVADLGTVKKVRRSEIYFVRPTAGHAYVIEASIDGKVWQEFAVHQDRKMCSPHTDVLNKRFRYLRIKILKESPVSGNGIFINKPKVYEYKNEYESPHMYCSIDFYFVNSKCICTE